MDLRGAVAFAVLIGGEKVLRLDPGYIREKIDSCEGLAVPEVILDESGLNVFAAWASAYNVDWSTRRDLRRPVEEVRDDAI